MPKITIVIDDDDLESKHVDIQVFGDFYNEDSPAADIARIAVLAMQAEMDECTYEEVKRTLN